MFENVLAKLEALEPLISATKDDNIKALSSFLYERITHPASYLVFLGETSCGKSSIINGFLNENILPVKASPSTAAITEIELSGEKKDDSYLAIYNNATAKKINKEQFLSLAENPDNSLNRLRLTRHVPKASLEGLRIFDTPGYGSIVDEHEEVLKEFLPNSDLVAYVVNYRIGIQDEDYVFLGYLKELIRSDVEVVLVINRCPENSNSDDRRIIEILNYARDIFGKELRLFFVKDTPLSAGENYALPKCPELWSYVGETISSTDRTDKLEKVFSDYIENLYERCDSIIQARYASALMSDEEFNAILEVEKSTAKHIRSAVDTLINPTFDKLINDIPGKLETAKVEIVQRLESDIENSKKGQMDEMIAYTNAHLLPFTISKVSEECVMDYVDVVLTDLNNRVDDYIQKEVINFSNEINIRINSNLDAAVQNVAAKVIQKLGTGALGKYFIQFGGAGGANAGIANAASHLLKKVGDLFGKTFSRETHNALKHALKKIGATSMKAVGAAVTVVLELAFVVYEYNVWKGKLKKSVAKGVEKWGDEAKIGIINDINKLREKNIETVLMIADEIEDSFDEEKRHDAENCLKDVKLSEMIGQIIKNK